MSENTTEPDFFFESRSCFECRTYNYA